MQARLQGLACWVNINLMASKTCIKFWISEINEYLRAVQKYQIDPLPEVVLDDSESDPSDILIGTGYYDCRSSQIVLRISQRHLKDILRTYCHELVHHHQNLDNSDYFKRIWKGGDLVDNPELQEIESEAYLQGNLNFRKFTEWLKKCSKEQALLKEFVEKVNGEKDDH